MSEEMNLLEMKTWGKEQQKVACHADWITRDSQGKHKNSETDRENFIIS
jgi:hypothetical protein